MIQVIATITLVPGAREEFLGHFLQLVPHVVAEDGCIEYFPAIDSTDWDATTPRADVVVVVEKWRDVPALKAHLIAPHMTAYRPKVKHLVANTQLQVLSPVG